MAQLSIWFPAVQKVGERVRIRQSSRGRWLSLVVRRHARAVSWRCWWWRVGRKVTECGRLCRKLKRQLRNAWIRRRRAMGHHGAL